MQTDAQRNMKENPNQLDIKALAPYLEANIEGFGTLESIEKFSGGQSNPTFRLITNNDAYVLRAKPPGDLLKYWTT